MEWSQKNKKKMLRRAKKCSKNLNWMKFRRALTMSPSSRGSVWCNKPEKTWARKCRANLSANRLASSLKSWIESKLRASRTSKKSWTKILNGLITIFGISTVMFKYNISKTKRKRNIKKTTNIPTSNNSKSTLKISRTWWPSMILRRVSGCCLSTKESRGCAEWKTLT